MKFILAFLIVNSALAIAGNEEIIAGDEHVTINLDGKDGANGGDRYICLNPQNGGSGNNGGDLYVHTEDLKKLANITLHSEGGQGGRRGSCHRRNSRGTSTTRYGHSGRDGERGSLYVLPINLQLQSDTTAISTRLETLADPAGFSYVLTRNMFDEVKALDLLAPGSVAQEVGYVYKARVQKKFVVKWNTIRPIKNELNFGVVFRINRVGALEVNPEVAGLRLETTISEVGDLTTVTINKFARDY